MAVGSHRQGPAVIVTEPATDCRNVHAGLDARRGEEMPKIVMGEMRKAQSPAGCLKTFLGALDFDDWILRLWLSFVFEIFKKPSQGARHWNEPVT